MDEIIKNYNVYGLRCIIGRVIYDSHIYKNRWHYVAYVEAPKNIHVFYDLFRVHGGVTYTGKIKRLNVLGCDFGHAGDFDLTTGENKTSLEEVEENVKILAFQIKLFGNINNGKILSDNYEISPIHRMYNVWSDRDLVTII